MELAKPPEDAELKNIIDKLAQFVARNGPEFEHMTKDKQKDNPKFSFLFGGEYFNYYQCRITTEQALLRKQQQQTGWPVPPAQPGQVTSMSSNMPPVSQGLLPGPPPNMPPFSSQGFRPSIPPPGSYPPPPIPPTSLHPPPSFQNMPPVSTMAQFQTPPPGLPPPPNIAQLEQQLQQLQQQLNTMEQQHTSQISDSERNLAAQYESLMSQKPPKIKALVEQGNVERLQNLCNECGMRLEELATVIAPIIVSCTKDNISGGKNWIFQRCTTKASSELIAKYILGRVMEPNVKFEQRLHLIYLVNDVIHHSVSSSRKHAEDLKNALSEIVGPAWCTAYSLSGTDTEKNKLSKLLSIWEKHKYFPDNLIDKMKNNHEELLKEYEQSLKANYSDEINHVVRSIDDQYASLRKQHSDFVNHLNGQTNNLKQQIQNIQSQIQQQQTNVTMAASRPPPAPGFNPNVPPPGFNPSLPPPDFSKPPPGFPLQPPGNPPTRPCLPLPDLSRPPPGFAPIPIAKRPDECIPNVPYYDLPAGLMVTLVKLEDSEYEPLDPKDLKLPPPEPPSERLLAAVEAFYSLPSHEAPRDAEGWEKLSLFEYYKAKQAAIRAKKERLEKMAQGKQRRSRFDQPEDEKKSRSPSVSPSPPPKSRSPSPVQPHPQQQPRPRYSSPPSPSYNRPKYRRSLSRSRSRSSSSRSRSRSKSPPPKRRDLRHRSRSRSPGAGMLGGRRSLSASPSPKGGRRSGSETPPSFFVTSAARETALSEENKGHRLLSKMGWGGGGLGRTEQGRTAPIDVGEARDKTDMYIGLGAGSAADPFERFRKAKSQGFAEMMKQKAEIRDAKRGSTWRRDSPGK